VTGPAPHRLRASPHVVCYWRDGELILHHVPTARVVGADPVMVRVLDFFRAGRSLEDLAAQWPPAARRPLGTAVRRLLAGGFLYREGEGPGAADQALGRWNGWNPVASLFHFATKDPRWAVGRARDAFETEFRRKVPLGNLPPPAVKRIAGRGRRVTLPRRQATGEFADVLLGRRTWRGFGTKPIELRDFAQLLDLTWGVRFWGQAGDGDPVAFKTSPSAGARHPVEAYVLARRVRGLPRGLYHYEPDAKALETVRAGASSAQVERYLAGQWVFRRAAAVVFMTGVVRREQWRYGHPRSYRTMLFDAGHLCQTFCLVATWLGLAPFCTAALADSVVEKALRVDGFSEVLLYAAGVGSRPPDGRWVQWPEHRPGHPYLPPPPSRRRSRRK
jgi:SagB-type dehydrogenase family enzyme